MLVFARLAGMSGAQSIKEGKMLRKLVITGLIGACAMPAMAANLLTNGGFESGAGRNPSLRHPTAPAAFSPMDRTRRIRVRARP
jgi:hypothetical protein